MVPPAVQALICACPMEELKGLGGVAGMSKTKYTSQQWERSKKKKSWGGNEMSHVLEHLHFILVESFIQAK